jgi:hypothetical protein
VPSWNATVLIWAYGVVWSDHSWMDVARQKEGVSWEYYITRPLSFRDMIIPSPDPFSSRLRTEPIYFSSILPTNSANTLSPESLNSRYRALADMQISVVMDKFESQFSDLDVQTSYMESTMSDTTALTTPQDQVDTLISQVADENGLEISQKVGQGNVPAATPTPVAAVQEREGGLEEDGKLAERLRALRVSPSAIALLSANG